MPVLMRKNTMIGNLAIKSGERENVSVTADGEKTAQDILYELAQKIDISKVNDDSYVIMRTIMGGGTEEIDGLLVYHMTTFYKANVPSFGPFFVIKVISYVFTYSEDVNDTRIDALQMNNVIKTDNHYAKTSILSESDQTSTIDFLNQDAVAIPAGTTIKFYY